MQFRCTQTISEESSVDLAARFEQNTEVFRMTVDCAKQPEQKDGFHALFTVLFRFLRGLEQFHSRCDAGTSIAFVFQSRCNAIGLAYVFIMIYAKGRARQAEFLEQFDAEPLVFETVGKINAAVFNLSNG